MQENKTKKCLAAEIKEAAEKAYPVAMVPAPNSHSDYFPYDVNERDRKIWINGYKAKSQNEEAGVPTFEEVFAESAEFSLNTFINSTSYSSLEHLKEEVLEVQKELTIYETVDRPALLKEYADCFLCLISSAAREGITAKEIVAAMDAKAQINKARKWKLNTNNTYSHVKE